MTKEELIAENAKLGQTNKEWSEADTQRRKSISGMLSAPYKTKGVYERESEQIVYSWPEIYFTLGKLVEKHDYANYLDTISYLEREVKDLLNWRDKEIKSHTEE